jgi:hypothetical protein
MRYRGFDGNANGQVAFSDGGYLFVARGKKVLHFKFTQNPSGTQEWKLQHETSYEIYDKSADVAGLCIPRKNSARRGMGGWLLNSKMELTYLRGTYSFSHQGGKLDILDENFRANGIAVDAGNRHLAIGGWEPGLKTGFLAVYEMQDVKNIHYTSTPAPVNVCFNQENELVVCTYDGKIITYKIK